MLKTIRQTLWSLRYALRAHPILVLSSFTLLTVLSFLPSVQMFLIAAITNSLSAGDAHTALMWAGVTGACWRVTLPCSRCLIRWICRCGRVWRKQVSGRLPAGSPPLPPTQISRRLIFAALACRPGCGRQRSPAHPSNQHRRTSLHVSYGGFTLRHGGSRQFCGGGMPSVVPDSGGVRSGAVYTAQRAGLG